MRWSMLLGLVMLLHPPAADAADSQAIAAATSYTIQTSDGAVARIGAFRPRRDPSIAAAQRVFGRASSLKLVRYGCQGDWRRLRLRIYFANFGGTLPGQTICTPSVGNAQSFTIRGSRFRTWEGLRVGHRSETIPERHRSAEFVQGSWWLRRATSLIGEGETDYGVVRAITSQGRVRALGGWIGAAGD